MSIIIPGQFWPVPVDQPTSLRYASQFVYHLLVFWKCLREEQLRPDVARDGTRFNMQQFRKLFNSTRIPQKGTVSNFLMDLELSCF